MRSTLQRIEVGIARLQLRVAAALRAGLEPRVTRARLAACGLVSDAEVEALYAWRDGVATAGVAALGAIWLFPGFYFLSIDYATANYRALVGDARWRPGWLPLFANGGGDFYVVELGTGQFGAVRHFRIDEVEHPIEFLTVGECVATLAAAYEGDVFLVADDGYVDMDDEEFARLARRLNPAVVWWKD